MVAGPEAAHAASDAVRGIRRRGEAASQCGVHGAFGRRENGDAGSLAHILVENDVL